MKNKIIKNSNMQMTSSQWKARRSELMGFQKTYYLSLKDGDYLRVDFNQKDKRIRLYVEVGSEKGTPYYSVIHKGEIVVERCVFTGRSSDFSKVFKDRASVFSTIPNKIVFKLINNNYGISEIESKPKSKSEKDQKYA